MNLPYRVLHVEDSPDDAELLALALRKAPFGTEVVRVEREPDYLAQLDAGTPDVIICDYNLPQFSAERALEILAARGLDVPFIVVSHHIGESAAVVAMQQGASDYLAKRRLDRLPKAIASAIERRDARRDRAVALEALQRSELVRRSILDSLAARISLLDGSGTVLAVNKAWEQFDTNRTAIHAPTPGPGSSYLNALEAAAAAGHLFARDLGRGIQAVSRRESPCFSMEYRLDVDSAPHWYTAKVMPLEGSSRDVVVSHRDVTDRMMAHLALQDAHARMQALSSRVLAIQEEERRVMSRELHDDVGQTLGALKIGLHRLGRIPPEGQGALLEECLAAADSALERLRRLAHDLRPPQLEQLGLEDALRWLTERQRAATGLDIGFKCSGLAGRRPPAALESACYRIVQEALSNATRHAGAASITVGVESDGNLLKVSVHDNGVGFDEAATRERTVKSGSLGLISMEERAQLAGGRLKIRSVAGGGTTISAVFPLRVRQPAESGAAIALAS